MGRGSVPATERRSATACVTSASSVCWVLDGGCEMRCLAACNGLFYVVDGSKGRGRGEEWRPTLKNVGAKGGIHGEPGGDRKLAFLGGGGGDEANGDW